MKAFLVTILLVAVSVAQGSLIGSTAIVGPSAVGPSLIAKGGSIVTSGIVGAPHGIVSPGYIASSVVAPVWGGVHGGLVAPAVGISGVGLGGWGLGAGRLGLGLGLGHGGIYH